MSDDIKYEEDQFLSQTKVSGSSRTSGIAGWLVQKGWARDDKRATQILFAVIAVALLIAVLYPVLAGNRASDKGSDRIDDLAPPVGTEAYDEYMSNLEESN